MIKFHRLLIFLLVSILLSSCRKDEPIWSPDILVPLINTNLGLDNIKGDSLFQENSDSSLTFVYRQSLGNVNFSDILKIPDTTLIKSITLKTIKLGTREITSKITLGQLARKNGPSGLLLLSAHGTYLPIPPIVNSSGGVVDVDATNLFESVEVEDGDLTAVISNGLPIELRDVIIVLKNKVSGEIILTDTVDSVMPSQQFSQIYPLDGKTIKGKLETEVLNLSSPGTGSTPVLIDTNNAVTVSIKVQIDKVTSAEAIFPSQDLINQRTDVLYNLNGPELKFMKIKSGTFKIIVASTLQDSGYITYSLPGAKYKGIDSLYMKFVLPPAPPGDTVYFERSFPVDDYWFDLTGTTGNKFNSYINHIVMRIDSSGKMMHLSLRDSIYLYYTLFDIVPEYVSGYLGSDSIIFSGTTSNLSLFKNIPKGKLDLSSAKVGFFVENGIGADADIVLNQLIATNSRTNESAVLITGNLGKTIRVNRAADNPLVPYSTTVDISDGNIASLIEILPDRFDYDLSVKINPDGNTFAYQDFVYQKSTVNAGIDMEIPLNMSLENLTLKDTIVFDLLSQKNADDIISGKLIVSMLNKFPISAGIQLYFTDNQKNITDSLFLEPMYILEGVPNANGRVDKAKETRFEVKVDEQKMERIRNANFIIVEASFDSLPKGKHIKLYSDYNINVKINADFIYSPKL